MLQAMGIDGAKAWLAKDTLESTVPKYAREPVDVGRQFTVWGTTNKPDCLVDVTGNRRFWVVPVAKVIDTDWIAENRDRIWAAAMCAYLSWRTMVV